MKLNVEADKTTMAKAMKEEFINNFNEAVEKGASKPFLKALHRQTLYDLAQVNSMLGYLPQDGITRLDMSWDK